MKKFTLSALCLGLVLGAGILTSAQITNVLNPASDLAGKTLVTAEGNRTISGTFTFTVPVRFAGGTAANPGITLGSDTSTGINMAVGTIGWSLAGTQRMALDASGLTVYGFNILDTTGHLRPNSLVTTEFDAGNSGTAITLNFTTNGPIQKVTRTGNATYTLTAPPGPGTVLVRFVHEASVTVYTVAFSPAVKFPSGTAPTWTNTSGAIDILSLYWDGTNWYGSQSAAFS